MCALHFAQSRNRTRKERTSRRFFCPSEPWHALIQVLPFRSTTGKHSLSKCGGPSLAKGGRCLHAFAHALKSCSLWLSAVLLSSSTVSAFPTSEVKNPYLLRQGVFDCLQRRHEEPEVRASSFLVWSLPPCRCMPCLRLACLLPSRSLSVHISVCSSSSTSVLPFTPSSCGGPRLLSCIALLPPLFVISSMWPLACSLKILSSAESLISFWISTFTRLACIYVCRGDHVCLNAHISYASAADPFQGTKRSTRGSDTRRVLLSPPFPPTHKPEQIVSQNTFHFEKLVLQEFAQLLSSGTLFRTSDTLWKSSLSSQHPASAHACHPKIRRALHAPPLLCVIQKIGALLTSLCPTSALVRFCESFLRHFADFSARSWWRDGIAPVSCSNHV